MREYIPSNPSRLEIADEESVSVVFVFIMPIGLSNIGWRMCKHNIRPAAHRKIKTLILTPNS